LDILINSISERFQVNKSVFSDCANFDSKYFSEIRKNGLSDEALTEISNLCNAVNRDDLARQLKLFAGQCEAYSSNLSILFAKSYNVSSL
jgi:hypothetical protein